MADPIQPFARALSLCDYVIGYTTGGFGANGKTDLYGLFNAIRPAAYPHTQGFFCVFAQLCGGLGQVPFVIDLVYRPRDVLVQTTNLNILNFPSRDVIVQMKMEIRGWTFALPGEYLVQLVCDNKWVADTPLLLLELEDDDE